MMARRRVLGLVAGGAAALLASCSEQSNTGRFKITVEVETPEGLRSGYSVVEEMITPAPWYSISESQYSSRFRGEAVAVDLPGGRTLFALLRNDGTLDMPNLIGRTLYPNGRSKGDPLRKMGDPPIEMPLVAAKAMPNEPGIPMLVTFRDIADPRSVEKVDPSNLAASFGDGISLKRITVEVTEDPVTTGIEKRLGWLPDVYKTLRGKNFKPEGIPVGNFKRLFSTELAQ